MNQLTNTELKFLNYLSQGLNPTVNLGDKIKEIIDSIGGTAGNTTADANWRRVALGNTY